MSLFSVGAQPYIYVFNLTRFLAAVEIVNLLIHMSLSGTGELVSGGVWNRFKRFEVRITEISGLSLIGKVMREMNAVLSDSLHISDLDLPK